MLQTRLPRWPEREKAWPGDWPAELNTWPTPGQMAEQTEKSLPQNPDREQCAPPKPRFWARIAALVKGI